MKKSLCLVTVLFIFIFAITVQAAETAKMEVLFMNHGPLRATIDSIRTIAAKYEGKLKVEWYDVYSDEGAQFMKSKRLDGHIPLMIWINGNTTQKIDGKDTRFEGFPSGAAGPATFQGSWDMELLDKALLQATK